MTDTDRNSRTLILCFSIALMALIPLRFVEYFNSTPVSQPVVLGDSTKQEVVLPNAAIDETQINSALEAPYTEIESKAAVKCVDAKTADAKISSLIDSYSGSDLSREKADSVLKQIEDVVESRCE